MQFEDEYYDLGRTPKRKSRKSTKSKAQKSEEPPAAPTKKSKKRNYDFVDTFSAAQRFIKRFRSLAAKEKLEAPKLYTFIKSLQKAIHERYIRRSDRHAAEIETIQKIAIAAYQRSNGKTVQLKVPSPLMEKITTISRSEKIRPSVSFLKRYVALAGQSYYQAGDKMISLLENLDWYAERKLITASDPYITKVREAQKQLEKAVSSRSQLSVTTATLSGLNGIIEEETGFFDEAAEDLNGFNFETKEQNPNDEISGQDQIQVMNSNEAGTIHFDTLPFTGIYQQLIGEPEKNFWLALYGPQYSGKSTFALGFAKYLSENFGRVLYISPEQYNSQSLKLRINAVQANGTLKPFDLSPSLEKSPDLNQYQFVFIDSVNAEGITLKQMEFLKRHFSNTAFITVLQTNKKLDMYGEQGWKHSPDIVLRVEDYKAEITKNRYRDGGRLILDLPKTASHEQGFSLSGISTEENHQIRDEKTIRGKALLLRKREKYFEVLIMLDMHRLAEKLGFRSDKFTHFYTVEIQGFSKRINDYLNKEAQPETGKIKITKMEIYDPIPFPAKEKYCLAFLRIQGTQQQIIQLLNYWVEILLVPENVTTGESRASDSEALKGVLENKANILFLSSKGDYRAIAFASTLNDLAEFIQLPTAKVKAMLKNYPRSIEEKTFNRLNEEIQNFNPDIGFFRLDFYKILNPGQASESIIFMANMSGSVPQLKKMFNHLYDQNLLLTQDIKQAV